MTEPEHAPEPEDVDLSDALAHADESEDDDGDDG
jgi:hypothetical protein